MKTSLEKWIDHLAREAATVEIVACFYAPGTPYHGCLIGVTGDGGTMPFWGCRSQGEVEADLQDRRVRYAAKSIPRTQKVTRPHQRMGLRHENKLPRWWGSSPPDCSDSSVL